MFRVQQDNEGEFQSWALSELCDWWMVRCELPKKWREIAHMSLQQKCHNDYQISKVINTPEGGSIRFLVAKFKLVICTGGSAQLLGDHVIP
jgi:hypothetical protein